MKLRPLHDRVIVKRVEQETKTASGILIIPDNAAEKPDQGEVLSVGPGKRSDKGDFIVAMNVKRWRPRPLFGKYSGQTVKVDGDELLVMKRRRPLRSCRTLIVSAMGCHPGFQKLCLTPRYPKTEFGEIKQWQQKT